MTDEAGPAKIRGIMKLDDKGDWAEKGDVIVGNNAGQKSVKYDDAQAEVINRYLYFLLRGVSKRFQANTSYTRKSPSACPEGFGRKCAALSAADRSRP
jgi:hypothetical protein